MEETKESKVVEMNERREPTVEELKNYCNQLLMQRNEVAQKLQEVTTMLNKLPWLFKVVEYKDLFDKDFVDRCLNEISLLVAPLSKEDLEEISKKREEKTDDKS